LREEKTGYGLENLTRVMEKLTRPYQSFADHAKQNTTIPIDDQYQEMSSGEG
jgi:hypothetical protein